jgi:hypothetical protein
MRFFLREGFEWVGLLESMSAKRVSTGMFSRLTTIAHLRTTLWESKHASNRMDEILAKLIAEVVQRIAPLPLLAPRRSSASCIAADRFPT